MRVVGVDPAWAKPCAGAYWGPDLEWAIFEAVHDDRARWKNLLGIAWETGCRIVAIEKPYMGRSVKTFGQLTTAVANVESVARECGFEVVQVPAKTWMDGQLSVAGHVPRLRKELLKRMVMVARALRAPVLKGEDDKAAAVCIAEYWMAQERMRLLSGGKA